MQSGQIIFELEGKKKKTCRKKQPPKPRKVINC